MTDAQATASLTQHARLFDAGAHVVAAAFVGGAPALALADGAVLIGEPEEQKRVAAHPDAAILTAISDGKTLLTGGDDGRVVAIQADGAPARDRRREGPLDRRAGDARQGLCLERRQAGPRARRNRGRQDLERAVDRSGPRLPAEGLSSRGDALQWRDALVSEGRRRAANPGVEGRPSRRRPSLPTGAFSSPRCRRTRCTAGGLPIRATCA